MAEEEKPKRKTALIKHKKTDTPVKEASLAEEKKKVVIVKKKVVKVKKSTEKEVEDKIKGDVDFENIIRKANCSPVPGGVGPLTVAMLINNVVKAAEKS